MVEEKAQENAKLKAILRIMRKYDLLSLVRRRRQYMRFENQFTNIPIY